MMMMKDKLGTIVKLGDCCAHTENGDSGINIGIVAKITDKRVAFKVGADLTYRANHQILVINDIDNRKLKMLKKIS